MAYIETEIQCCGIKELNGIEDNDEPDEILGSIWEEWFENTPRAFMFFSCRPLDGPRIKNIFKQTEGHRLASYIKTNSLGKIYKMSPKVNPNSGNRIHMWVWAVNNSAFRILGNKEGWGNQEEEED